MASLPDKPSELIRVALADLELCQDDSNYRIDMGEWHKPTLRGIPFINRRKVCEVCMAGAVMAQTLQVDIGHNGCPLGFTDTNVVVKLLAIDHFRTGNLRKGVSVMCATEDFEKLPKRMYKKLIIQYGKDPVAFRISMDFLANSLQEVGL